VNRSSSWRSPALRAIVLTAIAGCLRGRQRDATLYVCFRATGMSAQVVLRPSTIKPLAFKSGLHLAHGAPGPQVSPRSTSPGGTTPCANARRHCQSTASAQGGASDLILAASWRSRRASDSAIAQTDGEAFCKCLKVRCCQDHLRTPATRLNDSTKSAVTEAPLRLRHRMPSHRRWLWTTGRRPTLSKFHAPRSCGSHAGIGPARLCTVLHASRNGRPRLALDYKYLATDTRTTNQGVVGSNPAGRAK